MMRTLSSQGRQVSRSCGSQSGSRPQGHGDRRFGLPPKSVKTSEGTKPRRLSLHDNDTTDASFSPNGKWLASADSDGEAQVFRTDTYEPVMRLRGRFVAVGSDEVVARDGVGFRRSRVPSGETIEEIDYPALERWRSLLATC